MRLEQKSLKKVFAITTVLYVVFAIAFYYFYQAFGESLGVGKASWFFVLILALFPSYGVTLLTIFLLKRYDKSNNQEE